MAKNKPKASLAAKRKNKKQLSDKTKIKYCDHVVVNDKNLKMLKKNLLDIFKKYE